MRSAQRVLALVLTGWMLASCISQPALTFAPDTLPPAQRGQSYVAAIAVQGQATPIGSITVQEGSLPPGLVLEHTNEDSTATIRGTPAAAGTFAFTIGAWSYGTNRSGQRGSRQYVLVVE